MIGNKIKQLRKSEGLTQKEIADRLGVKQGYISRIERGLADPSPQLSKSVCRVFGVTSEWLFSDNDNQPLVKFELGGFLDDIDELRNSSRDDILKLIDECDELADSINYKLQKLVIADACFNNGDKDLTIAIRRLRYSLLDIEINF